MESRDLFETHARRWWPEVDLTRDGDRYRVAATLWMYVGWVLASTAAVEALRGKE